MEPQISLSEYSKPFKPHRSLLQQPYDFDCPQVRGSIFYKAKERESSGDTFIVKADSYLTVSLIGDMTGHGKEARLKLDMILTDLEHLVNTSISSADKESIVKELIDIDSKLEPMEMIALSFVRLLGDRHVCYFNHGENFIFVRHNNLVEDKSLEHGVKIGYFHQIPLQKQDMNLMLPSEMYLGEGDMILMLTDGVLTYLYSDDPDKVVIPYLKNSLEKSKSIHNCVRQINTRAYKRLKKARLSMADDYTLIGLEIK